VATTSSKTTNGARAANPKDAIRVLVGVAALGWAGREAIKSARHPKVLGVRVPRELSNLDLKKLDLQKAAKQFGKLAEQLESTSEDVRMISAQAKRLSKKLS
jgi:hypothetical protein